MLFEQLLHHWHVDMYEQHETQTDDVELILELIGEKSLNIFEICCGSGRILVPLAKAGHRMTGLDMDNLMITKLFEKAKGLEDMTIIQADALQLDWGSGYDVLVMAGNIMINIETDMDYKAAQKLFIKKAYDALKSGGRLIVDCSAFVHPERFFRRKEPRVIFEGTDSWGIYGKYILSDGCYDEMNQIATWKSLFEITAKDGKIYSQKKCKKKHIPSIQQLKGWMQEAGFVINACYGNHKKEFISETTHRFICLAEKPE